VEAALAGAVELTLALVEAMAGRLADVFLVAVAVLEVMQVLAALVEQRLLVAHQTLDLLALAEVVVAAHQARQTVAVIFIGLLAEVAE